MNIIGNAQGVADSLIGTAGADRIEGLSGNDVLRGGRGNDTIIGGQGNDVVWGGLDADTFEWSAGHIADGGVDYVADFDLRQSDVLNFRSSGGGQNVEVLSIEFKYLSETTVAAGGSENVDLQNNVGTGTDVVFTVRNSVTGATQEIVLLDAWSGNLASQWDAYLAANGWTSLVVTA